jgi:phosphonate transport system ATP-binding protein
MLNFENLTLKYKDMLAIRQLSLTIEKGERVAIIGGSGAGKTTLLTHIYQQLKSEAAYCSQKQGLVDSLSAYHNVYMGALNRHHWTYNIANLVFPFKQPLSEVQVLCDELELDFPISKPLNALSGGQRQRVALARALYQQKTIFIGDEPFSAVDPLMAQRLIDLVFSRHESVIMILHDKGLALEHFDRVIGLRGGELCLDIGKDKITNDIVDDFYLDTELQVASNG